MALDPSPLKGTSLPLIAGFVGLILIRLNPANVLLDTGLAAIGGALVMGFLPRCFASSRPILRWISLCILLLTVVSEYSKHIPGMSEAIRAPGLVELSLSCVMLAGSKATRHAKAPTLARVMGILSILFGAVTLWQLYIWILSTYPSVPRLSTPQLGGLCTLYLGSASMIYLIYHIEHLPIGRCSVCGYPLAGLETNICPECGTPFTPTPNTPTTPNTSTMPDTTERPRSFRPVAYRAALAMLAGLVVLWQAPGNSLERFKPNFILRRDANLTARYALTSPGLTPRATAAGWTISESSILLSTIPANHAIRELIRRTERRRLSPAFAELLIQDILRIQSIHEQAMGSWPDLFHELDAMGYVSAQIRRAFFEQSIVIVLVTRPRVQANHPVPYDIIGMIRSYDGPRRTRSAWLPTSDQLANDGIIHIGSARIDDQPITEPTSVVQHLPVRGSIFGFSGLEGVDRDMPKAPASMGEHTFTLNIHIGFTPNQGSIGGITKQQWLDLGLPLSIDRTIACTFETVAEPTLTIDDITGSEFHIRIQNSNIAFVGRDENAPADHRTKFQVSPRQYFISIGRHQAPSPVLTRAYIMADTTSEPIGWAYFDRRGMISWHSFSIDDSTYDQLRSVASPQAWRFIFRSEPMLAERTTSIERVSNCRDIIIPARYLGATHEHGP